MTAIGLAPAAPALDDNGLRLEQYGSTWPLPWMKHELAPTEMVARELQAWIPTESDLDRLAESIKYVLRWGADPGAIEDALNANPHLAVVAS